MCLFSDHVNVVGNGSKVDSVMKTGPQLVQDDSHSVGQRKDTTVVSI